MFCLKTDTFQVFGLAQQCKIIIQVFTFGQSCLYRALFELQNRTPKIDRIRRLFRTDLDPPPQTLPYDKGPDTHLLPPLWVEDL